MGAITGVYLGLRVWSFVGIAGHASSFPDTPEYENVKKLSVFSLDFWTWYKPWGSALLWKLLPGSTDVSAPIGQWLISIVAWLTLAIVVFRVLEHWPVKFAGFGLVLAFSMVPAVAVWDGALLSESLTLSIAALLVAALLLFVQEPAWKWAAAVLLLAFLLAGTRSTNGYLAPFLLIPVAAIVLRRSGWIGVSVAVGSLAIAGIAYASANVRQWQVPLAEIVAGRVLQKPSEQAYFVARGMPVRPSLAQDIWSHRIPLDAFETTPSLAYFMPWFNRSGRAVYTDYLLSHPGDALVDPIRDITAMIAPSPSTQDLQGLPVSIYAAQGYRAGLPSVLARVLYWSNAKLLLTFAILSLLALGTLAAMGLTRVVWTIPVLLLASCVPHAIIVWNGDDTSIGRHALLLAILFRLGLLIVLLYIADAYLTDRRRVASTEPNRAEQAAPKQLGNKVS